MDKNISGRTAAFCYLTYFMSGAVILCFGAILPDLIVQKGLNYTLAGGLLTCMTIGNLLSTIVYPALCARYGEKIVTTSLCVFYPTCLFLFTCIGNIYILYVLILLIGLNRGVITVTNNRTINSVTGNSPRHLNILHMTYACGAFLSPFLIALLTKIGIGWETVIRIFAFVTVSIPIIYYFMDKSLFAPPKRRENEIKYVEPEYEALRHERDSDKQKKNAGRAGVFLKMGVYWLALGMIFCYMGLENTVSGWFETYLQQIGLMDATLATMMVSVTWVMIMIGRLIVASLSGKIETTHILCAITILQFVAVILLLNAKSPAMVVISLVIFGLGLAGTYPTLMAYTGGIVNNSNVGMSMLTGCGALGGIVTPQLIGIVADLKSFNSAILLIGVDSVILMVLGGITIIEKRRRSKKNEEIYG